MMMKEGSIKVNFRTQGVGVPVLGCEHLSQTVKRQHVFNNLLSIHVDQIN